MDNNYNVQFYSQFTLGSKLKSLIILIQMSFVFSGTVFAKNNCPEDVGFYSDIKLAYESDAKLNAPKVKCLALAGDDRAATLYAEYLLGKYNDNGYKEDVIASYAWYKIAVNRSNSPGRWKKMPKILEGAVAGIEESSKQLYQKLQKEVAPRKRFIKPSKVVIPEETEEQRKKRIRKAKESGAPRVPSHRQ